MKKRRLNIDSGAEGQIKALPEVVLQYNVSKDEVWANLSKRIEEPIDTPKIKMFSYRWVTLAASVLILAGITGFFRLYTKTVSAPAGGHLTFCLPDSSMIELNAQTTVQYHPYWFWLSRTIVLDGEAFFNVKHGNRFRVISKLGETAVLGTSFNIYSRDDDYSVTCFTGKVRVVSAEKSERVLLNPDEQAFINKDGFLRFVQKVNSQAVKSWRDNMFIFTGSSVIEVLQEIERQYNIKIIFKADPGLTYTGNFSKSLSEKEVLDLVCTSLGIKFESKSDVEFLVN